MNNSVDFNCHRFDKQPHTLERWAVGWSALRAPCKLSWKFLIPLRHFLGLLCRRVSGHRSNWQDVYSVISTPVSCVKTTVPIEILFGEQTRACRLKKRRITWRSRSQREGALVPV